MKKTLNIDLSSDRLLGIASDLVDGHNYIGALKMLNKNAESNFNDEDAYMLYAEIYDDIGLYEKSVNYWYKYIDTTLSSDLGDAYEGLAVAYMNMGDQTRSAYYYNRLLKEDDMLDAAMRREIMDSFLVRDSNPLKFVYPPEIADFTDVIADGIEKMKKGDYDKAVKKFEKVAEGNKDYLSARNYIAMCKIISDKYGEAEEECLAVLKNHPDNIQALTTLAAVKTEMKDYAASRALAERLLGLDITNPDELYKIATVCCENGMHGEAYEIFARLDEEFYYDCSVLYFKAISAFNCGRYDDCFAAFDRFLAISPNAVTAKYHYRRAREEAAKPQPGTMSYFYRLPREERESTLKTLAAVSGLGPQEVKKLCSLVDLRDCLYWCVNETDFTGDDELKTLAASCAVKAGLDAFVCDMLLNAFLPDSLKVSVLTMIGERNEDNCFGVVMCHMYRRIVFHRLEIGRAKRKNFLLAYARLTAHFAIIKADYGERFCAAAERVYNALAAAGRLSVAADADALTAAVFSVSGVREPKITRSQLAKFFETDDKKINAVLAAMEIE